MGFSMDETNNPSDFQQDAEKKRLFKFKRDLHSMFDKEFIAMKNLQEGMTKPCVLDIKLGSKAYNEKKL
eukprot:CAMPEP_0170472092 /NCGR_PEP_ID=MMETSP0123-20130129/14191_1 /TAXON_ID=182087 /ORGANISM="Favella ehrenbergii, Strain Fehren 1" /LENGTH=68 /DNA_ID=CAMNT_0010740153 /DNA_START=357 /DNA_END=563 /DNA_ORIENTATION=-